MRCPYIAKCGFGGVHALCRGRFIEMTLCGNIPKCFGHYGNHPPTCELNCPKELSRVCLNIKQGENDSWRIA